MEDRANQSYLRNIMPGVLGMLQHQQRAKLYQSNPALWAYDYLGVELWWKQEEIALSVVNNRNVAVKAGHSVGKSFLAGLLACWWIDVHPLGEAYVASTAPSVHQINSIVWKEIRKFKMLSERRYKDKLIDHFLPGYITADANWKLDGGLPIGSGRKPPEHKEDAFQGLHAEYLLAIGDEACHDDQTEVLTDAGWKFFKDLDGSEKLLSMDPETHEAEYLQPTKIIAKPYSGPMHTYEAKGANFSVTPDHTMYYGQKQKDGSKSWRKAQMQDMKFTNRVMKKTVSLDSPDIETYTIPAYQGVRKFHPARTFAMDDWAEFWGWYGSEGSLPKSGDQVRISQLIIPNRDKIVALLGRMGYRATVSGTDVIFGDTQLSKHLLKRGRTCEVKRLPPEIRTLSKRQMDIFLDAYILGDGYTKQNMVDVIYTSCEAMADDLNEICLLAGYNSVKSKRPLKGVVSTFKDGHTATSSRDGFVITRSTSGSDIRLRKESETIEQYDGMVYCATVPPHHLLFTRRKGYAMWSGNCGLPEALIDDLGNITTGENCRRLLIANPTVPSSYFGKIFREATGTWVFHTISVMDSPNFHGGGICQCHPASPKGLGMNQASLNALVGPGYVEDKKRDYGENSARYKARVLGEFAYEVGQTLFTEEDIAPARDADFYYDDIRPVLGVDLSGNGPDSNVIYANYPTEEGSVVRFVEDWGADEGFDLDVTLEKIEGWAYKLGAYQINVDAAGMGVSVWQQLTKRARQNALPWQIVGLNGGGASPDRARWQQARAWWYDTVREDMRAGKVDVDPEEHAFERLSDELLSIQYEEGQRGLGGIQLEQKKDMKKRGMKSPDFADAFILSLVDTSVIINNPLRNLKPGEQVQMNPWDLLDASRSGAGMPI